MDDQLLNRARRLLATLPGSPCTPATLRQLRRAAEDVAIHLDATAGRANQAARQRRMVRDHLPALIDQAHRARAAGDQAQADTLLARHAADRHQAERLAEVEHQATTEARLLDHCLDDLYFCIRQLEPALTPLPAPPCRRPALRRALAAVTRLLHGVPPAPMHAGAD